jgi:hypothetical protein
VDARDRLRRLSDVPQSDVGAPLPCVVASEYRLLLAYHHREKPSLHGWSGRTVQVVDYDTVEVVAMIDFPGYYAYASGPPNDETIDGHPLAARGLEPYAAFEVADSSWIRQLEQQNRVHPDHREAYFAALRHYIFVFHDSTFEVVAREMSVELVEGSLASALQLMAERVAAV